MGLDMYAMTTADTPAKPVDFIAKQPTQLHYWRKHPNLHGWMEALYREKGGEHAEFNCAAVRLTAEDLQRLEADIAAGDLPFTIGAFFGESQGDETEDDLAFVAKARDAIAHGLTVYYDSWW